MDKNKLILPISILLGCIILRGFYYASQNNTAQNYTVNQKIALSDNEAFKIVQNKYLKSPQFTYYKIFNNEEYIVSYIKNEMVNDEDELILLKKFAGDWIEDPVEQRAQNCFDNTEWVDIENFPYLYASCFQQGTGSGSEYFSLFSFKDKAIYYINISGGNTANGRITKDQVNIDKSLESKNSLLVFLENKIASSEHLYKTKKEDLDIESNENAIKKWQILNPDLHKYLELKNNIGRDFKINIKKYDISNIEDFFSSDVNKDYVKNSKWETENSSYKIISYFKGAIYAYDKNENKYFVLWVPSDMYNWVEKIEFTDDNNIVLYDRMSNLPFYNINLKELRIVRL